MTLKPPQLPLPDDPIEAFLYALMAAVDVSLLLMVLRHFSTQPPATTLDELFWAGVMILLHVTAVVVAKCDLSGLDD